MTGCWIVSLGNFVVVDDEDGEDVVWEIRSVFEVDKDVGVVVVEAEGVGMDIGEEVTDAMSEAAMIKREGVTICILLIKRGCVWVCVFNYTREFKLRER